MMSGEVSEDNVVFPLGTVVIQYVNDSHRVLGVVVNKQAAERLTEPERATLVDAREPVHVLLVLQDIYDYPPSPSIFNEVGKTFPYYMVGRIGVATPVVLREEIALRKALAEDKKSRGLISGSLRRNLFSFNGQQREMIDLVVMVQHFMAGGTYEDRPKWITMYSENAKKVMAELQYAIWQAR
jgi:hypothetical protein